ncbi:MAG: TM2 domain-containing protein [Bacteroidota bacterium]
MEKSDKGFVPTVLLCLFLGSLGVHRFYVGKTGTGILQLLTLGGLGIWSLVDLIMIITGNFKDREGFVIKN